MHVELDAITKTFGSVRANDNISMRLDGGRIYAVLGENGAGKSTLMKIVSGYQPPDSGRILLDGRAVQFGMPADALRFGIGMLHQEPLDVPSLTVMDNFILGRPGGLLPDRRGARQQLDGEMARFGFTLNPDAYIDTLTIGERQQLEIMRLLSLGARVLILDEPTTGISAEQKDMLFQSLRDLAKNDGLTVVLVSHKLEDVEALCDQVIVLRAGRVVGEQTMPISTAQMVDMMFGQRLDPVTRERHSGKGRIVLQIDNLHVEGQRLKVEQVYLKVAAGEVIGMAGLDGSGQLEMLRACAGLEHPTYGRIMLNGEDITQRPYHEHTARGIAFAPAGRLEEGLISGLTVSEHFALASPPQGLWVDWKGSTERAQTRIAEYSIRGQPASSIQTLSGGNQQRVLLALLPPKLQLLLLDNPTRGLDVESARWIWSQLLKRHEEGTAILFVSPDLDEIIEYSDRIAVFYGGRVTLINDPSSITAAQLGGLIGGKTL